MAWQTSPKCLRIDEPSATETYFGFAVIGSDPADPVWRIMKMTQVGTETLIQYSGGNTDYNSIWDDRLSYTYTP